MQSPTHTLIALALFAKRGKPRRNLAIFIGSIIPDAFIYIGWIWLTFFKGETQAKIWNELYFQDPLQAMASLFNSVPLYFGLAVLGFVFARQKKWARLLYYFALAALIHIAFDFPVHAHDAYAYFEPFTSWRFHSPLSYYEADHHGKWVGLAEMIIAVLCLTFLWRRFSLGWVRVVLGVFAFYYAAQFVAVWLAPLVMTG